MVPRLVKTFIVKKEERDSLSGTLNCLEEKEEYPLLCQGQETAWKKHPRDKRANPGQPTQESQYHSLSYAAHLDLRWALRS